VPDLFVEEQRFRAVFRRAHSGHRSCIDDEWLMEPCRQSDGRPVDRPLVWSRRNGPWCRTPILWVGAAPGNAGGLGRGELGAHGTRIPFGGDIAGANLEVLLGNIGLDRNRTFITAALNRLPARGGGEPTRAEIAEPVGAYDNSLELLRDTILAAGPGLVAALGNVALRCVCAAVSSADAGRLPSLGRLRSRGAERDEASELADLAEPSSEFERTWRHAWGPSPLPVVLWLTHPSGQNMSPYAREETRFHQRLLEARQALRAAVVSRLGWRIPDERPNLPETGIYALPEWRERIRPRHAQLDALWRERGV
jgi:uracil-DNA glycosylase